MAVAAYAETDAAPDKPSDNLHRRLDAVMGAVEGIKATGKNEYKNPALSIGDVEQVVRPLLARHGVVIRFRLAGDTALVRLDGRLWQTNLVVRVVNADDPGDHFEDLWSDIGATPSAAYSFTRKGYLKALLHLAEGDDDGDSSGAADHAAGSRAQARQGTPPRTGAAPQSQAQQQRPPARPPADNKVQGDCPACAAKGVHGTVLRAATPKDPGCPFFCAQSLKGCGQELAEPVRPQAQQSPAQAQPAQQQPVTDQAAPAATGQQPVTQQPTGRVLHLNPRERLSELYAEVPREQRDALRGQFTSLSKEWQPTPERFVALVEQGAEVAARALTVMATASALPDGVRPTVEEVNKALDAGVEQAEVWVAALADPGADEKAQG